MLSAGKVEIKIHPAKEKNFPEIFCIFKKILKKGDTYVNRAATSKEEVYEKWMNRKAKTFVAEINGKTVGAYLIKPNQVDRGSHIGNASYIVDENCRGAGVGKTLALHSISKAKELGYKAIQFNFVVSTNVAAVNLWKSVGFRIIGTTPGGFNHKDLGYVDSYIMFREL
jgi:L-amino acid N-acyltransferase YncA